MPERRRRSLWVGLALLVVGLVGAGIVTVLFAASRPGPYSLPSVPASPRAEGTVALGERIFLAGVDQAGSPIPRSAGIGMMVGGCASCHGSDGRGRTVRVMMGSFITPDIRWNTLTSPNMTTEAGEKPHPPYDPTTFARALRDGVDPGGNELEAPMPRWQLTQPEIDSLILYLRQL